MDNRQTKPLISTEGEDEKPTAQKPRKGCLSSLMSIAAYAFIILLIIHSCSGEHETGGTSEDSEPQVEERETTASTETPVPASYEVTIVLSYEEVSLTTNSPMNVCVDDLVIGRQDAGTEETYTVTLDEGEHKFYLKNDGLYSTSKLSFDVSEQNTYFRFGTKTRLTFGMEVWEDSADNDQPISTFTSSGSPALDGKWIDTCLAKLGNYSLNATLSPELYTVTTYYSTYAGKIDFLKSDMVLSASVDLISNGSTVYGIYELSGWNMERTIDTMFEMACDALSETAAEVCSDYKMQISEPVIENRTNGNTTWRVCTYTGDRESDDMKMMMSHYFYMDENLRASITIMCIISDSAVHSSELEAFNTWVDVLQSSLEIDISAREADQATGNEADYTGTWEDTGGQSCVLEITAQPIEGYYTIDINWWVGNAYFISWTYDGVYNQETGGINCYHGSRSDFYKAGMDSYTEDIYTDIGEAELFLLNGDYLEWVNYSEDMEADFPDMLFNFTRMTTQ